MRASKVVAAASAAMACALGMGAGSAAAQPTDSMIAGTVTGGWNDYTSGGSRASDWVAAGSAVLTLGNPGFNIQANFDNDAVQIPHRLSTDSQSADVWSFGGDLFWRDYAGSIGINLNLASTTSSGVKGGLKTGTTSYDSAGWFGQFFALSDLTLELKGGRIEEEREGWYGDGAAVFYPFRDLALSVDLDYANEQHVREELKEAGLQAEFLPVREIPVSMYLGYDFGKYSQLAPNHSNIFFFGFKAYLGGGGREGTLVDYQRNGTTNWDGPPPGLVGLNY